MKSYSSILCGRRVVGVLAVVFVAACSVALHGGESGDGLQPGSVKLVPGLPAGADIPVAPLTHAVPIATALHNEGAQFPGTAAAGVCEPPCCDEDVDCDDCNTCTEDLCVFSGGAFTGVCEYTTRDLCEICGDDSFCNGVEICDEAQGCQLATFKPCETDPTKICDENEARAGNDPCVLPCGSGGINPVPDDGSACNGTEVCDFIECVGGNNAGALCEDDTPCTGAGGYCGGVVIHVNPPCGTATSCVEGTPVTCTINGRCCTVDANDPLGTGFACDRTTKDNCTGNWLQVGDRPGTPLPNDEANCVDRAPASESNAGEGFMCPVYGGGVAPSGSYPEFLGQVGHAVCADLSSIGDDYTIADGAPGGENAGKFVQVNTIRWVGGFQEINIQDNPSRYRVVFYDLALNRIEDVITGSTGQGDAAQRTIVFEEQPFIPAQGYIVIEPAPRFSPFARVFWATTDATDVGSNDVNTIWLNGQPQDAQTMLPGTTGVLAFEIIGDIVSEPLGACCDAATGDCSLTLPWLCNGSFQGAGVECQVCANDPFTPCVDFNDCHACLGNGAACNPDSDCPSDPGAVVLATCNGGFCDSGPRVGEACDVNVDCDAGDTCDGFSTCVPVPPACALSACCTDGSVAIPFCEGGTDAGNACTVNGDCADGGTCTGLTGGAGECVTVVGGFCSENGTTACVNDGDCTGTCVAPCPTGTASGGFGSSCDPQLCAQAPTGFDTCAEAKLKGNLVIIDVPEIGKPPVTVTFSGDNSTATYNDHQDDAGSECTDNAASCVSNADCTAGTCSIAGTACHVAADDCPSGETCDGSALCVPTDTCNFGLLSSQGGTKDRGWWHAFSINDCAVVRVDFCGTAELHGDIRQPQWAFIATECDPCGVTLGASIVGAPVGEDNNSNNRGLPFCTGGDDLWETFGPLQPGIYWQPVYSAPGGYIGPYQMHVVVGACPIAACCLPTFHCVDPGTQFLITDGADNPVQCGAGAPVPVCAVGSCESCALAQEPDCKAVGGFWNALQNLPAESPAFIVDCGFAGDGPCDLGSCCLGAGNCQDTPLAGNCNPDGTGCCNPQSPSTCMNRTLCVDTEGGDFVGGAQCDYPTPPCPACNVLGANNCQLPANDTDFGFATGSISDLTTPPNGTLAADDFIPLGSTLTSVCVWGFYADATLLPPFEFECIGAVDDEFRVRVFADNNGIPGALIGQSLVTTPNIARGQEPDTAFEAGYASGDSPPTIAVPQGYTLLLDDPIIGMAPGETHWLEVANNTTGASDEAKTCWWNWLHHYPIEDGEDGYSVGGANSGGTENAADYLAGTSRYISGSGRPYDLAFCVGQGAAGDVPLDITPTLTLKAACWTCPLGGDSVCTVETQHDCVDNTGIQGIWNRADPLCSGTFADVEAVVADSCTGAPFPASAASSFGPLPDCGNGLPNPGEQCDLGPDVPGDNCDANCQLVCPTAPPAGTCSGGTNTGEPCNDITDCPDQTAGTSCDLPAGGAVLITAGLHMLDTNCGGTDGPDSVLTVEGTADVGNDSWYHYETTCTGKLWVSACPTQPGNTKGGYDTFDNLIVIYRDDTKVCLGGTNAEELCPGGIGDCPDQTAGTSCEVLEDFLCPGASSQFQKGKGSDEGCNGMGDTGPGILNAIVLPGEKYTIRVTNWGTNAALAGAGPMLVDVDCVASACLVSQAPTFQRILDSGGTPRDNKKGRMLPVIVNDVGRATGIQVEFVDLPPPYDLWNGKKLFARAPIEVCETSTIRGPNDGPCLVDTYPTAKLECTDAPFTTDWNSLGVVNLWHEGIVAGGVYNVRVIDAECNPTLSGSYSDPTEILTARFGDTVSINGFEFPADNAVNVGDALAGIATFSNASNKPSKSRTELASGCISHTANIDDVLMSLSGFAGGSHPAAPSTVDPCDSACTEP